MSDDDELRRRLQDIPAPGSRLDPDAVIAGAKRRRRPKTIALSSAATVAGVLIVAPLVVPGLQFLRPGSTTSVSTDAGAAPESAQESGGADDGEVFQGGGADSGSEPAGEGDQGASGEEATEPSAGAEVCGLPRAGDIGLALTMLEEPSARGEHEGVAPVEVRNTGTAPVDLEVAAVRSIEVTGSGATLVGGAEQRLDLEPGESAVLTATTAVLAADACGDGTPSAALPVAIVAIDGSEPLEVVGEPWADDVR